jgi:hypothetical protein
MPKDPKEQPMPEIRPEEAQAQLEELQPKPAEALQAPKGAQPGEHPLNPIQNDPERLAAFVGGPNTPPASRRAFWDTNAYGKPVLHYY